MVPQETTNVLGKNVARFRRQAGLSAEDLAAKAQNGLTRSIIANLENGRKADLSVKQLVAVAYILGVSPTDLLYDLRAPYERIVLAETDEGPVTASAWLARGWFAGDRYMFEVDLEVGGETLHRNGQGSVNSDIEFLLRQRDLIIQRIETASRAVPVTEELADDYRERNQNMIRLARLELVDIDRRLAILDVDMSAPHVGPGGRFSG